MGKGRGMCGPLYLVGELEVFPEDVRQWCQVVLTTISSLVLTPCLAGWSGTPALSAGPPKGAT